MVQFNSFQNRSGVGPVDLGDLDKLQNLLFKTADNIVAGAGGTGPVAVRLAAAVNHVTVCASANDSVMLPPALQAVLGAMVSVINDGAQTCKVFGNTDTPFSGANDTISANAGTTSAATATVATGVTSDFTCFALGKWKQVTSA